MFSGQIEFESAEPKTLCQLFEHKADDFQLRALEREDTAELFSQVATNRARLRQWLPWLDDNQTEADSSQFIQRMQARAKNNQGFAASIRSAGAIIGIIDLQGVNWNHRTASIGYWIDHAHEGKGFVTRACAAVVTYAFTVLALNRIEILCATANGRSQAVPQRLGFTHEGKLRQSVCLYDRFVDHELYAVLKQDWH